ncbi:MAG TPA: YafY family protein [Burkholderiales bacterium]|nr:YafY family protein [Burkholderiales bacterium]
MDRTERFYKIDRLLRQHRHVPVGRFLEELDVSLATFKRDIEYMRSRLHAPIVWDREENGYAFTSPSKDAPRYELPGLWFNASEIYALLMMEQLLENIDPGVLARRLEPLKARLATLLGSADHSADEVRRRIKVLTIANRALPSGAFETAANALLGRKRLFIRYRGRVSDEDTEREVSPQRLVHYRDNWYLDAWCHMRKGLRSFSMDCVRDAEVREGAAIDVPAADLDAALGSSYGIFSGAAKAWAKLRFSPVAARWVASEAWHADQKASREADGSYVLEVPYSDDRELLRDILRFGPDVEVLGPDALRARVREALAEAAAHYQTRV